MGPRTVEYRESIYVGYRYYDTAKKDVRYPFGYGLSYTKFEYSDLKLSKKSMKDTDTLTVTYKVKNVGDVAGAEVSQVYVKDNESTIFRPEKELKGLALEVKEILEEYPSARDDNWDLIFAYHFKKFQIPVLTLLSNLLRKINIESLTRAKRKVQELFPHLRGEKRLEREKRRALFVDFSKTTQKDLEEFWEDENCED